VPIRDSHGLIRLYELSLGKCSLVASADGAAGLFRVGVAEGADLGNGERGHLMELVFNFAAEGGSGG
jgi:hypothetical protein